jgi:hypothetical protein
MENLGIISVIRPVSPKKISLEQIVHEKGINYGYFLKFLFYFLNYLPLNTVTQF